MEVQLQVEFELEAPFEHNRHALLGLFGSPYLARELPFGWSNGVAAIVMDADRWDAGIALMQAAHPNRWNSLVTPWKLINGDPANAKAVAACQAEVRKIGKPQACRIVVKIRPQHG